MIFNSEEIKKKFKEISPKIEKAIKDSEMKQYRSQLQASKFYVR